MDDNGTYLGNIYGIYKECITNISIDIYGCSLYNPYIYFLAMWSMFSLVCFLIYGVKSKSDKFS